MKANNCGHEWIISLTQQEEESDLDASLVQIIGDLLEVENFAIYINKHFSAQLPPTLINTHTRLEVLESNEALALLNKVTQNKIRVSRALGVVTTYVPVYYFGKVIGILLIETTKELAQTTTMLAVHILNIYANQLGLLHKSRLDPLTELLNRQTFDKKVIEIVSGKGFLLPRDDTNEKRRWYLAIADIDHFKRVNDSYGHAVGDDALCKVARCLKSSVRSSDAVGRLGGDEFVVLAHFYTNAQVNPKTHHLKTALNRLTINHNNDPIAIKASMGTTVFSEPPHSIDEILKAGDTAMYHEKIQRKVKPLTLVDG